MKPAFDQLAAEYEGHASVLIGDSDCTADGQSLCSAQGVSGYPTIKCVRRRNGSQACISCKRTRVRP
jgi:hypothetical protein